MRNKVLLGKAVVVHSVESINHVGVSAAAVLCIAFDLETHLLNDYSEFNHLLCAYRT